MFAFPLFENTFKTLQLIIEIDWRYKIDKQIDTKDLDAINTCCKFSKNCYTS